MVHLKKFRILFLLVFLLAACAPTSSQLSATLVPALVPTQAVVNPPLPQPTSTEANSSDEWNGSNESYFVGSVEVINHLSKIQFRAGLFKKILDEHGSFIKGRIFLSFVTEPFVMATTTNTNGYIGVFDPSTGYMGQTFTRTDKKGNPMALSVVGIGLLKSAGFTGGSDQCPNYGEKTFTGEQWISIAILHEVFGHAFLRANGQARDPNEECAALALGEKLFDEYGQKPLIRSTP